MRLPKNSTLQNVLDSLIGKDLWVKCDFGHHDNMHYIQPVYRRGSKYLCREIDAYCVDLVMDGRNSWNIDFVEYVATMIKPYSDASIYLCRPLEILTDAEIFGDTTDIFTINKRL